GAHALGISRLLDAERPRGWLGRRLVRFVGAAEEFGEGQSFCGGLGDLGWIVPIGAQRERHARNATLARVVTCRRREAPRHLSVERVAAACADRDDSMRPPVTAGERRDEGFERLALKFLARERAPELAVGG